MRQPPAAITAAQITQQGTVDTGATPHHNPPVLPVAEPQLAKVVVACREQSSAGISVCMVQEGAHEMQGTAQYQHHREVCGQHKACGSCAGSTPPVVQAVSRPLCATRTMLWDMPHATCAALK